MPIEFTYAGARAQARLGTRPSRDDWRLLESAGGLAQYLHSARATPLAPVVRHFTSSSPPHAIDRSLRNDWRAEVDGIGRWVPQPWRESVAWTAWLPYLPAVTYLADGGEVTAWVADDPVLSALALHDADARRQAILDSVFSELAHSPPEDDPLHWWMQRWQATWPANASGQGGLRELVELLQLHLGAMQAHTLREDAARDLRGTFETRVARLLRAQRRQPAAVFCHLLLTSLDLWRLRSGLIRRALYNGILAEAGP